jgi:16S rRNA (cytidine1402-2'-O)-methyltransferase
MSILYIIPTPIGNLKDITFRALEILKEVDFLLAEDTRSIYKILTHYDIQKKVIAYHQFNEHKRTDSIVKMIHGKNVALVSDAGTPGISDPGYVLVNACIQSGIEVQTLPGATAFVPALINSGLPSDKFYFHGFLPHKKGRLKQLEFLKNIQLTSILYESPHRLLKTLEQMSEVFGANHKISISREISKIHEETLRGTISEIHLHFSEHVIKGEFVIVIAPYELPTISKI